MAGLDSAETLDDDSDVERHHERDQRVERLGGIDEGHDALLKWIDSWLSR